MLEMRDWSPMGQICLPLTEIDDSVRRRHSVGIVQNIRISLENLQRKNDEGNEAMREEVEISSTESNWKLPEQHDRFVASFCGHYGYSHHSGQINRIFSPMRSVLHAIGRFPFSLQNEGLCPCFKNQTETGAVSKEERFDRWRRGCSGPSINKGILKTSLNYTTKVLSFHWFYFLVTSALLLFVLITNTISVMDFYLQWEFLTQGDWNIDEERLIKNNVVPFVLYWSCLLHATVGNISFIINRKRFVDYMNYWNVSVDLLRLDVPYSIKRFLIACNLWYLGFLVLLFITFHLNIVSIASEGSMLIGLLSMKPLLEDFQDVYENEWKYKIFGVCILLYAIYASRVLLFIFAFKTKLLMHAFKVWNERLEETINKETMKVSNQSSEAEGLCKTLYRDHCILLRLVALTDEAFGGILQSYYASQVVNMCFELYYLARSGTFRTDFHSEEHMAILAAIILLMQNVYFFFRISLDAAFLSEEAAKGIDIIRCRGLAECDSQYLQYLVRNLRASFTHRIVLTGGKFFALDRPFIVTVIGAVLTYFIIILQFQSAMT